MAEAEPPRRASDPWPPVRPGLGAWWRDHVRIGKETVRFISLRIGTSLLVWLLVGIALAYSLRFIDSGLLHGAAQH